jgi:MraZ protein
MSLFFGKHENRLDQKGRVSIPANFRGLMKSEPGTIALVLCPSSTAGCVEVWSPDSYRAMAQEQLAKHDRLSKGYKKLAARLFAEAWPLETDKEGRIMLPPGVLQRTGIKDAVAFFGVGENIEIWEPVAGAAHLAAMAEDDEP